MIYKDILEATGHTPLIRLNKMTTDQMAQVLVKFEGLNVGGSIKTRTALYMIEAGEHDGRIKPDTIIVEPTSGNQGIGLALIGAVRGYKTIIIMPDSVSEERRKLITHYGAEVRLVHDCGNIGDCIENCLKTALDMAKDDPRIFVPQQFSNPANPRVHIEQTALEIFEDAGDIKIDGFTSGVGTGGTLSGVGKMLRKHNPEVIIWAVEPEHAAILAGGNIGTHLQMGIGDGLIPENLDMTIFNDVCIITDSDAISTAQDLAQKEGLMCGISSGTNVAAALRMAKILGPGKTVVTILPDTAERYFSTPLFANI
ncbi:MAG: PLP-dependent cysteine synthase family protein [Eubacteriales bacterium]